MLRVDGRVTFWTMPEEKFRYSITSNTIETRIVLENRTTKLKWECGLDDMKMKESGPESIQLPRHVIIQYLAETLKEPMDSPHRIMLQLEDQGRVSLTLTLVFGPMFAPTYTLLFLPVSISTEEQLESQIIELQEEMNELRQELAQIKELIKEKAEPRSQFVSPNSKLNAKATEYVYPKALLSTTTFTPQRQ